jgi:deazaflavin-dependent oxidoreductase (nitroreductase family)
MLNTPVYTEQQMRTLRRFFHTMNGFMVFMWKIGMGRMLNAWPAVIGRIMIIRHRGRKSGKEYLTPVNYAIVDEHIYCMAGFGSQTDWYRNVIASPSVRLRLPQGWRGVRASDVSESQERPRLLRAILIASGFAGPFFGVDQRKLTDAQMLAITKDYRLIHFEPEG